MKAMILAAGLGTRLRPLTIERAKPAIPLIGKPLVVTLIEKLMENGVSDFRINLHHLPHTIEQLFNSTPWSHLPVSFSFEPQILGTAGGLKTNEAFFQSGTFFMANGDIIQDFPLAEALSFHREHGALATLLLYQQDPPYLYSPIRIDEEGRLKNFKGISQEGYLRPETYLFTGIHILEPEIFRFIPPEIFCEINGQVYPEALRRGMPIYGFPVRGYWNDLGDPGRYLRVQMDWFQRLGIVPPIHISPETERSEKAFLGPFVSAGAGCVMEPGARVENTILWENVHLKRGASVRNCIVGSGMIIDGVHMNEIISRNGTVPLA
jgi:NDP-sugar pyrophosphorylase family protein